MSFYRNAVLWSSTCTLVLIYSCYNYGECIVSIKAKNTLLISSTILMMFLKIFKGPGKEIYAKGAGGDKGQDGGEEKLYCQV